MIEYKPQGWIKLHRKFNEHPFWQERRVFSKAEAWIDILMECNHAEKKVVIGQVIITCKRGESLNSLDTWARRWGWNKSAVVRFLKLLESETMVESKPTRQTKHLSVCKYETYQSSRNSDETQMKLKRNSDETQMKLNKNDKNEKKEKNDKKPSPKGDGDIEKVWASYPNKKGKKNAVKGIARALKTYTPEDLIKRIHAYSKSTDPKYYKHGSTYFNGEHYEDELQPLKAESKYGTMI